MTNQIYIDNGTGIISDLTEGLMWQKETPTVKMTWEDALDYCENLNINCFTGWRLPTIKELLSLVDYNRGKPSIDINYFPDTISSFYWSSTDYAQNKYNAWGVDFHNGYDGHSNKNHYYHVRAVRNL